MIDNNEVVQEQNALIFLKLITGEEIIATFISETDDSITISEPIEFKRMIGQSLNITAIGTLNYTFFLNNHIITIRESDIMFFSYDIVEPFVEYYHKYLNDNPQSQRNLFKEPEQREEIAEVIEDIELTKTDYESILNTLELPAGNTALH